jgi:hypothetical protein
MTDERLAELQAAGAVPDLRQEEKAPGATA